MLVGYLHGMQREMQGRRRMHRVTSVLIMSYQVLPSDLLLLSPQSFRTGVYIATSGISLEDSPLFFWNWLPHVLTACLFLGSLTHVSLNVVKGFQIFVHNFSILPSLLLVAF